LGVKVFKKNAKKVLKNYFFLFFFRTTKRNRRKKLFLKYFSGKKRGTHPKKSDLNWKLSSLHTPKKSPSAA